MCEAGGGELFAVAAFGHKFLFQGAHLLVEQVVGLVNETDEGVGDHGGVLVRQPRPVESGLIGRSGRVRRIALRQLLANAAHGESFGAVFGPLRVAVLAEVIFVIEQQFVETGTRHVDQAQFGLAGGGGRPAALGDVLPTGPRGLRHLIHEPGMLVHKPFAE